MIKALPVLAYHFGLSPSDVWAMSIAEYDAFQAAVTQLNRDST